MSSGEKIMEEGGEGTSQDTPQAITITIMDPSALETTTLDSALVASVEAQDSRQADGSLLVVPGESNGSISVAHSAKELLQTVTETHMGTEDLPVISNINSSEDTSEQSTIQLVTKGECDKADEIDESEGVGDFCGYHCLICNEELQEEQVPVFKTQTATSQRKVSIFLGVLVGQKITSRKAHSDIICQKCFDLLNKLDFLEVEIRDTKEEIVNKYQETVASYGGRARRKKPAAAKKSDYVFPKIEPEDEDEQAIALEMDETFEPHVDDLMEEEHDRREDRDTQDEEWEPEFKRARVRREATDTDPSGPPKRKRGRPRKDASNQKGTACIQHPVPSEIETKLPSKIKLNDIGDSLQHYACTQKGDERTLPSIEDSDGPKNKSNAFNEVQREESVRVFSDKQCPACECIFLSAAKLKDHFNLCHSNLKSINCGHCKTEMACDLKVYFTHCKSCFPNQQQEKVTKVCGVCHMNIKKSDYVNHMSSHKELQCPVCKLLFERTLLRKHMITHCHKPVKTYKCIDCSAVYKDASNLGNHRKRNHLGQEARRHLCEVCGNKFVAPSELRVHVSTVHHNMRKYICEFCGLRFKIASELSYHRRTHTGEKPHICKVCGRTFIKPNALAKHVRWVHRMEYQGRYKKRLSKCGQIVKNAISESSETPKEGSSGFVEMAQVSKDHHSSESVPSSSEKTDTPYVKVASVYSLSGSRWITFPQL